MRRGVWAPTGNAGKKARGEGLPLLLQSAFMTWPHQWHSTVCWAIHKDGAERAGVPPHCQINGIRALWRANIPSPFSHCFSGSVDISGKMGGARNWAGRSMLLSLCLGASWGWTARWGKTFLRTCVSDVGLIMQLVLASLWQLWYDSPAGQGQIWEKNRGEGDTN